MVTAALLGCWGVLKFAPGAAGPGSARPTATKHVDSYVVAVAQKLPANETKAEALARQQNEEIRLLKEPSVSATIRKVVGPEMSEQKLHQIAIQAIVLCPTRAEAQETLIANGVPSAKVQAVIEAAC
jgi:hypothetical protein